MKLIYKIIVFLLCILITIGLTYFAPENVASLWYVLMLIMYYRSSNEAFWLAYFITVSDGFMGFLGSYSTILTLIPGLPGIEMTQYYILISLLKIYRKEINNRPYYWRWTKLLLVYTVFLVIIGIVNGLSGEINVYFRVVKLIIPLFLLYSVPRLMKSIEDYKELLDLIFVVFIMAFAAQIFTVFTGYSPANNFKTFDQEERQMEAGENLRAFYNPGATLITLLGSIFFLSIRDDKHFMKWYLYLLIGMTFFMAFLSATRGWMISTGLIILLFFIVVQKGKNLGRIAALFFLLVSIGLTNTKIREQTFFSIERFMTLEALAGGDETAGGTLARLNERGPRVLAAWSESPLYGWGFSTVFFDKCDWHVGNQNILMQAGILGLTLLLVFFIFINITMVSASRVANPASKYKNCGLVFVVFFMGYFILHSTSGQQFGFYGLPGQIFPQAVFLGMSSVVYNLIRKNNFSHEI